MYTYVDIKYTPIRYNTYIKRKGSTLFVDNL